MVLSLIINAYGQHENVGTVQEIIAFMSFSKRQRLKK
jgi:hypothetical protein